MTATQCNPVVHILTTKGTIWIGLDCDRAPVTSENFLDLVKRQFYDGLTFHRYVEGHVIQAGDRQGDGLGGFMDPRTNLLRTIPLENCPTLTHDRAGIVGMARDPKVRDSASSQFYITLAPRPHLDGSFAVFGFVVEGLPVVERLRAGDRIINAEIATREGKEK